MATPSSPSRPDQNVSYLKMEAGRSKALVSLHGGQVMSLDLGLGEVLWTGGHEIKPGEGCWGGIPLCWPWFMNGWEDKPVGPFHGPARFAEWRVAEEQEAGKAGSTLVLELPGPVQDSLGRIRHLDANLRLTLADSFRMELVTVNHGQEPLWLEHCFHAYFQVGDVTQSTVTASEPFRYWSAAEEPVPARVKDPVPALNFEGFYSEIFAPFPVGLRLVDPVLCREIDLLSRNASHLVVWNSGPPRSVDGRSTGEIEWKTQLALEPLQGRNASLLLQPGESALLDFEISCRPLA